MKRTTGWLVGFLFGVYIVGQSFILLYGQVAHIALFTKQKVYVKEPFVNVLSHQLFADKDGNADKPIIKLGNSDNYINVDLNTVESIVQKSKIYYGFEFKVPNFIDNRSSIVFHKNKENLETLQRTPQQLYGELYIVKNGTYDTQMDCGYKSSNTWVNKNRNVPKSNWHDVLVPLIVPDGHTFQHFIDGTLPKIIQALPVLQNRRVKILMRNFRDKIIFELFDRLNISREQLVFTTGGVFGANTLVYPCITPPVHPELWQESRRLITGIPTLQVAREQAYIVFITRKGCHNCGRKILNQDKVIDMLTKRYGDNVVKTFNGPQTLATTVDLFSKARVVMGPHGGGMYNINFSPSKTVVIEFMPTRDNGTMAAAAHTIIWHQAQLLDQEYWRMGIAPSAESDMNVDLTDLEHILDIYLDKLGTG